MCIKTLSLHQALQYLGRGDSYPLCSSLIYLGMAAVTSDMFRLKSNRRNGVRLIPDSDEPLLGLMIHIGTVYGMNESSLDRLDKYLGYVMVSSKGT